MRYKVTYENGFVQEKILIPHSIYLEYKIAVKEYDKEAVDSFKKYGDNWFTDESPLFKSFCGELEIISGTIKVKWNKL